MEFDAHGMRPLARSGRAAGPLSGFRFAVKDNFDVAGDLTGLGNPAWAATHSSADATAPAVQRLLDAGAELVAKTLMDELAYGITGRNVHYGTPLNPSAPDRVPGGSSSGSASAVAAGLVDFALGSDTGGSIRVPASFCGLFGMRPSHGRIPVAGLAPLAPSFDTVGWFARSAEMLERVGRVLLQSDERQEAGEIRVCDDLLEGTDGEMRAVIATLGATSVVLDADLAVWAEAFRVLQGYEVSQVFGAWAGAARAQLGDGAFAPDVWSRLAWAETVTTDAVEVQRQVREAARRRLAALTSDGAVLCFPTTPTVALARDFDGGAMDAIRTRIMQLTCIAGLAGAPQISVPLASVGGLPCGVSFVGAPGRDEALLHLAARAAS